MPNTAQTIKILKKTNGIVDKTVFNMLVLHDGQVPKLTQNSVSPLIKIITIAIIMIRMVNFLGVFLLLIYLY